MFPDFLLVGAAKSGTSSLDRYLAEHPQIYIPPKKEAHYFSIPSFPAKFQGRGDEGMNTHTIRQREQYEQLFVPAQKGQVVGESSAFYLYYPGTAERIYHANPNMKIIITLRNPVDRAFSAYMYLLRDNREELSFEAGLEAESERKKQDYEPMWLYKELGLYSSQIKRYFEVFPREQIKIILFEDFTAHTSEIMRDLYTFLAVDPSFTPDTSMRYNESGVPKSRALFTFIAQPNALKELVKPFIPASMRERLGNRAKSLLLEKVQMNPATRRFLTQYYQEDIIRLQELIGRDLQKWLL
ncbi:sulfotransferase family protein [Sulfoacidibacillus thermotolerans]|uniref:sulfotransferase family protein n=1 Tax=Sulfoacidibacillus thermotolerans TaxID=1765684 RepID=UPI001FE8FA2C|nr:sulfotransferase [Sulfoacidibacillus thermotolerans]